MKMECRTMVVRALAIPVLGMAQEAKCTVDYKAFLGQHDMLWDRVPHRWEVSPYTGNGNVGFLFYQARGEASNVISIYAGRHDYYDHRLPHEGHEMLWIYRSRLPLGHFNLASKGAIVSADLRLDLWNAELTGTITTGQGAYNVRGLSHSLHDVIYFETEATDGESIKVAWHPDDPMPPVRATLDRGGGSKGGTWSRMRTAPMPMPLSPTWSEADGMQFCFQPLHDHRGEATTGWEVTGQATGKQILCASIHHSFSINGTPAKDSQVSTPQDGFYQIPLEKGDSVPFSRVDLEETDLKIEPIPIRADDQNLFGYSKKTERLPGHRHYSKR